MMQPSLTQQPPVQATSNKSKDVGDKVSNNEEEKEVLKEALREWLDAKFAEFGKWSLGSIVCAAFIALIYFMLSMNGWSHK
jgi:hypothetical protein